MDLCPSKVDLENAELNISYPDGKQSERIDMSETNDDR